VWEVEYTDQFEAWWDDLDVSQQRALASVIDPLIAHGPNLRRPIVGAIRTSRHNNMKELRTSKGGALRVLFAFDPRRHAILLLGATRRASGILGTGQRSKKQTNSTTSISTHSRKKIMAKNIHILLDPLKADPEGAAIIKAGTQEALAEIALHALRKQHEVTQVAMATRLQVSQGRISQLESGDDALVSTISDYVEALGAELKLSAVFESGTEVPIHLGR